MVEAIPITLSVCALPPLFLPKLIVKAHEWLLILLINSVTNQVFQTFTKEQL